MKQIFAIFCLLGFLNSIFGQTVSTLVQSNVGDDLHFAADGYIYSSHYGGTYFRKINPHTSEVDTILTATTSTIGAIELDEDLNIYTCSYDLGWVGKFMEGDNTIPKIATGLLGPAGITHDAQGNLYVATNQNHAIVKIHPDGSKETYVQGSPLFWPTGITIDPIGNLYVANMFSGQIIRVNPDKQLSTLTTLPVVADQQPDIAYLTWANGNLFVCHFDKHVVYRIDPETGSTQIIAGSGQSGYADGPALEAKFQNPTGIVATPSGDTLFITDGPPVSTRLRMVVMNPKTTGINSIQPFIFRYHISPNPVDGELICSFFLDKQQNISYHIYDLSGKRLLSRPTQIFPFGENTITLPVVGIECNICLLTLKTESHQATILFYKSQ